MQHSWSGETDSHSPPPDVRADAVNSTPDFAPVTVTICGSGSAPRYVLVKYRCPDRSCSCPKTEAGNSAVNAKPTKIASRMCRNRFMYSKVAQVAPPINLRFSHQEHQKYGTIRQFLKPAANELEGPAVGDPVGGGYAEIPATRSATNNQEMVHTSR